MEELALNILDIIYNSIKAKATFIRLYILDSIKDNIIRIRIEDNGVGMRKDILKKVTDPFFTTRKTRKVGLGTSLLKQMCEDTEGEFKISSKENEGTVVEASFRKDHLDTPPMGDLGDTMVCLVSADISIDYEFTYQDDEHVFEFKTKEFKEILEDVPISNADILLYIRDYIRKGVKNEID